MQLQCGELRAFNLVARTQELRESGHDNKPHRQVTGLRGHAVIWDCLQWEPLKRLMGLAGFVSSCGLSHGNCRMKGSCGLEGTVCEGWSGEEI